MSDGETVSSGPRMRKLRAVMEKAVNNALVECNEENFKTWFPDVNPNDIRNIQKQILSYIQTSTMSEFNVILDNKHVQEKMNELDKMIYCQKDTTDPVNIPTPEQIALASVMPFKEKEFELLKRELTEMETENRKILEELHTQREKLKDALHTLSVANDSLSDMA